ncbi:hypothetical protein OS493_010459 [Desmophyllum pertusum]|uniref:Uncharacterized protein n=1 Tax=Desmophyllum pertusum TaxID=174260 RepID=A0A9X0A4B0_9CNID|nr:hypothetical protein OS493_010459 [Desmophyllum pertusum]
MADNGTKQVKKVEVKQLSHNLMKNECRWKTNTDKRKCAWSGSWYITPIHKGKPTLFPWNAAANTKIMLKTPSLQTTGLPDNNRCITTTEQPTPDPLWQTRN